MKRAKKSDWKTIEMPNQTQSFLLNLKLTKQEYETLQIGHIPKEMEDKWFEYFENNTLFVHRSWTGICIYMIKFSEKGEVIEVIVNRDAEQYHETDIENDKIQVMILINSLTNRSGNAELMMKLIKSYNEK